MDSVLSLLKMDLGIVHSVRDAFFMKLIEASEAEIRGKGITLDLTKTEDQVLLSDYAVWNYRKRQEDVPLSKNIQFRIRNRVIKERVNKNALS